MKALISLAAVAALAASISGCNTVSGLGRDVSAGGQAVSNTANNVRSEWREWRHRHDSEYETARSACAGGSEEQREACRERVRADYRTKMAEARNRYHRAEMRSESERDRMEDAYESARDSCYALRGGDEDRCLTDVRTRYPNR